MSWPLSFEDEQIGEIMNELFVNIKVDREAVVGLYPHHGACACRAMTGQGGWPMSARGCMARLRPGHDSALRTLRHADFVVLLVAVSMRTTPRRIEQRRFPHAPGLVQTVFAGARSRIARPAHRRSGGQALAE